jgi:integrase
MADKRRSRPTLRGTRIYERRGWLQHYAREPILDKKTGEYKLWHKLAPVGVGDEWNARQALHKLLEPDIPDQGDFSEAFKKWRLEVFEDRKRNAPKIPEKYTLWMNGNKSLNSFFDIIAHAFQDANVADIMPMHVNQFLKQWHGRRAAQAYRGHLSKFFSWATSEGYRESNPATAHVVMVKAPRKRDVSITPEQFHAVREAVIVSKRGKRSGDMVQCYIDLTYLLYQRTTDVRLLRWRDIDLANSRIFVEPTKTKGSSGIAIYIQISPAIRAVLDRVKAVSKMSSMFVIHTPRGQVYTARGMRGAWNRACKRVGVEGITLKDIRSMAATDAIRQGFSRKQIMLGLAHKKETTTDGYFRDQDIPTSEVILNLPMKPSK